MDESIMMMRLLRNYFRMHENSARSSTHTAREDIQVALRWFARVSVHLPSNNRYKCEPRQR